MATDKIQLVVEDKEWDLELERDIYQNFVKEFGNLITDLITDENERTRRIKTKILISSVIHYTREY